MKKIMFLIIIFMLVPMMVFADAAGPSIIGFDAVVTNKNGAKSTSSDDIIPYNTKIHVYDEHGDNKYSACLMNGEPCFEIDGKDIMVLKDEVNPKDLEKDKKVVKKDVKAIISNKDGAKVRKGPSEIYEVTNTISYYSIIDSKYYAEGEGEHGNPYVSWIYLDTNEYHGWINIEDCSQIIYDEVMLFKDIDLFDDSGNVVKKLNRGQIISGYTYNNLIYYNNKILSYKGDFYDMFASKSSGGYAFVLKSINLTSGDGKSITGIPSKTKVKILYGRDEYNWSDEDNSEYDHTDPHCVTKSECYYYVEYNGQKGFINAQDAVSLKANYKEGNKSFSEEKELHNVNYDLKELGSKETLIDYLGKSKLNITIPSNTSVTCYTSKEIYGNSDMAELTFVNYNGTFGWIISNYTKYNEEENKDNPKTSPSPVKPTDSPKPIEPEKETKPTETDNTILYCIIAGIVVSLSAIATIIILNKKKNKKQEEQKEKVEVKKEENKTIEKKDEIKKESVQEENGVIIPPEPTSKEENE